MFYQCQLVVRFAFLVFAIVCEFNFHQPTYASAPNCRAADCVTHSQAGVLSEKWRPASRCSLRWALIKTPGAASNPFQMGSK